MFIHTHTQIQVFIYTNTYNDENNTLLVSLAKSTVTKKLTCEVHFTFPKTTHNCVIQNHTLHIIQKHSQARIL